MEASQGAAEPTQQTALQREVLSLCSLVPFLIRGPTQQRAIQDFAWISVLQQHAQLGWGREELESSFLAAVAVRSAASCRCTMICINLFRLTLKCLLIQSLWWCVDFKWFPELWPVGKLQQSLEKKTFPLTSVEFSPFYIWSQSDLGLNGSP